MRVYGSRVRSSKQVFEQMRVKSLALEWMFNVASGRRFRVSADNLNAGLGPSEGFKCPLHTEGWRLCERGLTPRVWRCVQALAEVSGVIDPLSRSYYELECV